MPRSRAFPYLTLLRFISPRHLLLLLTIFALRSSFAETTIPVPMKADRWLSNGNATFTAGDHAPKGVLEISKGQIDLKDLIFEYGTTEFDMYIPDHGILGIRLSAQNRENAETLFFRLQKECNASPDCLQYMPLEHGTCSLSIKC